MEEEVKVNVEEETSKAKKDDKKEKSIYFSRINGSNYYTWNNSFSRLSIIYCSTWNVLYNGWYDANTYILCYNTNPASIWTTSNYSWEKSKHKSIFRKYLIKRNCIFCSAPCRHREGQSETEFFPSCALISKGNALYVSIIHRNRIWGNWIFIAHSCDCLFQILSPNTW